MKLRNMVMDNLTVWYSIRAKILFQEAERYYEQFKYAMCIFSSQESIEFSLKSILRCYNVSYKETHEISKSLNKLANQLKGKFKVEINNAAQISAIWLGECRNLVRYGITGTGTPPEELEIFNKDQAKTVLNAAKEVLNFLYKVENEYKYPIKIGILNGYVLGQEEGETQLNSFYSVKGDLFNIDKWKKHFNQITIQNGNKKYTINEINASEINNKYQIIINPFGEIYPEIDLEKKLVYKIIKEYIYLGGIFVNAGGFPFYYGKNVKTNEEKELVEMVPYYPVPVDDTVIVYKNIKPFTTSLLWRDFGVRTTADTKDISGPNRCRVIEVQNQKNGSIWIKENTGGDVYIFEFRAIIAEENKDIIPLLKVSRSDFGVVYPISAIKFGRGYLFLGSMNITTDSEFKKLLEGLENFCEEMF